MTDIIKTISQTNLTAAICEYFNVLTADVDNSGDIWIGHWVDDHDREACLAWINRGDAMVSR